jgi:dienelactone hydrolase
MRMFVSVCAAASLFAAEPLPNTRPLTINGDPASQMIAGITTYLLRATNESVAHRKPTRERLRKILGVEEQHAPLGPPEFVAAVGSTALLAQNSRFRVYAVRWPVLDGLTAEGLYFEPVTKPRAAVVTVPDADQLPEQLRINEALAAAGCAVLSPVLIDRNDTWSGNPRIRMTNQPHREFVYRMAFPVGRHILGYEVQKVLAALDWFGRQSPGIPLGVWGYGEGGAIALYSAALDERISAAVVSGYFEPREGLWKQPLYRNVFGLLHDFGDAELASMIAPRRLLIETVPGPSVAGPSTKDPSRKGGAPGSLAPAEKSEIEREYRRALAFKGGVGLDVTPNATSAFIEALHLTAAHISAFEIPVRDAAGRQHRQFQEMVDCTQRLVRESTLVREALWSPSEGASVEKWQTLAPKYRTMLWDDVIGRLPASPIPLNVRTAENYSGSGWTGYEVMYDVAPDVFGYGVLLVPRDVRPGERRPVVVAQHGLDGRPQFLFSQAETDREKGAYTPFHFYQNIGSKLAELGFVVYMPQNPYIGDFRHITRLANPVGLSLYSFILAQNDRLLDWLSSLPFVDSSRIGFYGLSYGGKTALRVPALLERYALSICSGDFNEWIAKLTSVDEPFSYMFTHEYEILEFDLARVANHSEMAKMIAPRPFMVERGHRDGVGIDEWVASEYAKVKRFYDEMSIGDRTEFEYFNGPHMIHGVGTVEFLRKHLGR